ncbi:hypothetical protein EVAR_33120_1 [Eumeta japonica]|uniref:Uncharacterized protein n=1 Tax=Eumeta variegata TaxID=151549 RepID=A0A4C1YB21_EUMVA|nr:hypothetical protein EVAR_33120_1 [Eumeta japonica]
MDTLKPREVNSDGLSGRNRISHKERSGFNGREVKLWGSGPPELSLTGRMSHATLCRTNKRSPHMRIAQPKRPKSD